VNNDQDFSDIFNNLSDELISMTNTIKERVCNYFVENVEFSSAWLRKLEERQATKDHAEKAEKESKSTKTSEREKPKEIIGKVLDLESESSLKENNEKLDDEPNGGLTPEEEKHNSDASSKEGDKPRKTLTTTSTKLQKKGKSDPIGKKDRT